MPDYIINAAPMAVDLGRNDRSTETITPTPLPRPTHCPKFYLYTKKGKAEPMLVDGAKAAEVYGSESFETTSKYYNHATAYAAGIMGQGNAIMLERAIPEDATQGSLILWAEFANQDVPVYQRDPATGKEVLDVNGSPVPVIDPVDGVSDLMVDGYKIRWSLTAHDVTGVTPAIDTDFGSLSPKIGTLTHKDGANATAFPILELKANSKGSFSNLSGIRIFPAKNDEIASSIINDTKVLPFFLEVIRKSDADTTASVVASKYGDKQSLFYYKENTVDAATGRDLDIGNVFMDYYSNTTDVTLPLLQSDFDDIHVYYENIDTILDTVFTHEAAYIDAPTAGVTTNYGWFDFSSNLPANKYLTNLHSAQSSKGVPYFTIKMDTSNNGLTFTKVSDILMDNGSDGTMDDASFAAIVSNKMEDYLSEDSPVYDNAVNVESIFYDSGFPLATKLDIAKFVSKRKDTFVSFATYISGDNPHTVAEDISIANSIYATLSLYADSTYFGTSVFRASITGQSAIITNSPYKKRVGLNYEQAIMSAAAMGASNRIWDLGAGLGRYPGNAITKCSDIKPSFIPNTTKYTLWNSGLIWAQPYDASSYYFPGMQTVHDNDTSVLNNYIVAMACIELDKIGWDAHRNFTNTSCLTDAQLSTLVTDYVNGRINDINSFDGCIKTNVLTFYTQDDNNRGYSWHLTIQVGGPNLKTVETLSIETYRINDLPAA